MGRFITRKVATVLLSFAMIFSCLFVLVSCGKKDEKVDTLSIELVTDDYTMKDGVITTTYGSKVELDASDFKVVLVKADETTTELALKSGDADGYTFSSTIPSDEKTPAGDYKISFAYGEASAEVKVKVNKAVIEVADARWNYTDEFKYNGTERKVELVGLPEDVTATYKNNTAVVVGNYTASATLSYVDSNNYEVAKVPDLNWKVVKGDIDMSNVQTTTGFSYTGQLISSRLENVPQGVYYTLVEGDNMQINAGTYKVKYAFEYRGEDANYYNPIEDQEFEFTIGRVNFAKRFVAVDEFRYNGEEQTITKENFTLPEGVKIISMSGTTSLTTVEKAQVTLTLEFSEDALKNFYIPANSEIVVDWEIKKYQFSNAGIRWNYTGAFTYDGTQKSVELTGLPEGLKVKNYVNGSASAAGTYTASVVFDYDEDLYIAPNVATCSWTIHKKALTITANDAAIEFSDTISNTGVTYSGFISGENENISHSGDIVYDYIGYKAGSDVGTYVIKISDSTLKYDNYQISYRSGTLTVTPKAISVADAAWNYTIPYLYNGQVQVPELVYENKFVEVSYVYKLGDVEVEPINVGTYTAIPTFATSKNYTVVGYAAGNQTFKINKVVVTVTANNHEINYFEEGANAGVSYSGFVNSETAQTAGLTGEVVYEYIDYEIGSDVGEYEIGSDVGKYEISIANSTLDSANYVFNYVSGELTVNSIEIDMSRVVWNYIYPFVYNGSIQKPILLNVPEQVEFDYEYKLGNDTVEPINAGTYTATAVFEETNNYTLKYNNVQTIEFVIQKVQVTVTANNHTIDYYSEANNAGVSYAGFVNSETDKTAGLTGNIVYEYVDYEMGAEVDQTFEISIAKSTLSAANYTFKYESGELSIQKIVVDLAGYEWDYAFEITPPVYDGKEHAPTILTLLESFPFIQVEYSYRLQNTESAQNVQDEEVQPINAGLYVAEVQFSETKNYSLQNAEFDAFNFEIKKATIDESKLGFNVELDEQNVYKVFYNGNKHIVEFVNNSGAEFVETWAEGMNTVDNAPVDVGLYHYSLTISLSEESAVNYKNPEKTKYDISILVEDYIKSYNVTYVNSEATDYQVAEVSPIQYRSANLECTDCVITNIIVEFAVDEANAMDLSLYYSYRLFTDKSFVQPIDSFNDLSYLENTIIVAIYNFEQELFEVRELKIDLNYNLTSSDVDEETNPINLDLSVNSGAVSITTQSNSYSFTSALNGTMVSTACTLQTFNAEENQYNSEATSSISLIDGINKAKVVLSFTISEESYYYSKEIVIVKTVNSDDYVSVSSGAETSSKNVLQTSYSVSDIADNLSNISVNVTNEDYVENTAERALVIENGNHYLRLSLSPKIDTLSTEDEIIYCYILLNLSGTLDNNINASIHTNGVVDWLFKTITIKVGQYIDITAENQYATIKYMNPEDSSSTLEGVRSAYINYYKPGTYYIEVLSTNFTVMGSGSSIEYMVIVEDYSYNDPTDTSYAVGGTDYFEHFINSDASIFDGSMEEYLGFEVNDGEDVHTVTLTNWDSTKYLIVYPQNEFATAEVYKLDEGDLKVVILSARNNVKVNFASAGTYYVDIVSEDKEHTRTIKVIVNGVFDPFLSVSANEKTVTESVDNNADIYGEFISYINKFDEMSDEQDSDVTYLEAFVGKLEISGDKYDLSVSTVLKDYLYAGDLETKLTLSDGKLSLDVQSLDVQGENVKFVTFAIKNVDTVLEERPGMGDPIYMTNTTLFIVKVYFCDKEDLLKYHNLTIGSSSFDVKFNVERYGDFGDVLIDAESGMPYVEIEETDVAAEGETYLNFSTYAGYEFPKNGYDYLIFTKEGYQAVVQAVANEELDITNAEELNSFIATLKTAKMAYHSKSNSIPVTFNKNGCAILYICAEGLNASTFVYGEYLVQQFEVRVKGLYVPPIDVDGVEIFGMVTNVWFTGESTYYSDIDMSSFGIDSEEVGDCVHITNWSAASMISLNEIMSNLNFTIYDKHPSDQSAVMLMYDSGSMQIMGVPTGTYYLLIENEQQNLSRVVEIILEGDMSTPLIGIEWNGGTPEDDSDDISQNLYVSDYGFDGDMIYYVDNSLDYMEAEFVAFLGSEALGAMVEELDELYFTLTQINTIFVNNVYDSADLETRTKIASLENVKFVVQTDSETLQPYVEFFLIGNAIDMSVPTNDAEYSVIESVSSVRVYLCSKEEYLDSKSFKATITLGESSTSGETQYKFNLDWNHWFDVNGLKYDTYNGYYYIKTSRTELGLADDATTLNASYNLLNNIENEDYALIYESAYQKLKTGEFLSDLIAEGLGLTYSDTDFPAELTLQIHDGYAMVAVVCEGGYKIVPIYIFLEDDLEKAYAQSNGDAEDFDFEDYIFELDFAGVIDNIQKIEFSITIGENTYSIENGDFKIDHRDNIVAIIEENRADVVTNITPEYGSSIEVLNYTSVTNPEGSYFVDSYGAEMTDNVIFTIGYNEDYGMVANIDLKIPNIGDYYIVLVFADNMPPIDEPIGPTE